MRLAAYCAYCARRGEGARGRARGRRQRHGRANNPVFAKTPFIENTVFGSCTQRLGLARKRLQLHTGCTPRALELTLLPPPPTFQFPGARSAQRELFNERLTVNSHCHVEPALEIRLTNDSPGPVHLAWQGRARSTRPYQQLTCVCTAPTRPAMATDLATAAAAAMRLHSTLAMYRKASREGDVTEAVASLERVLVAAQTRGIGSCPTGRQPRVATIAAALAFNAGCGTSVIAMARRFGIPTNISGVKRLSDRLAARLSFHFSHFTFHTLSLIEADDRALPCTPQGYYTAALRPLTHRRGEIYVGRVVDHNSARCRSQFGEGRASLQVAQDKTDKIMVMV